MNLEAQFSDLVRLIQHSKSKAIQAVNTELINCYWQVGEYISQMVAQSAWGDRTVSQFADYISLHHSDLHGFNSRGLYRMKQFYEIYSKTSLVSVNHVQTGILMEDPIVSPVVTQLSSTDIRNSLLTKISWTHHLIIISQTKIAEEREFYIQLCIREKYSKRELERQISSSMFERVMIGNQTLALTSSRLGDLTATFKDKYVFEFLNLPETYSENELQKALLIQLKGFILELGKDFLFIGEEYRLQVGNSDFYIDLLFYHRGLQCLIAFELKADAFKPEHLGQLNFYLEALDRDVKKPNENPSIGILLCKNKDNTVVEYTMSRYLTPALVAEYQTQLPDKKMLQQKVNEIFSK